MRLDDLRQARVLIFGFGKEGEATVEKLRQHGIDVAVTDQQNLEGVQGFLPIDHALAEIDGTTVVIKSPGIPPHNIVLEEMRHRGAKVTSSSNIFFAERKGRGTLIAITGTKGKTTTSSLLAHVLQQAGLPVRLVGNIGLPAIVELDAPDDTIFVIEISSYQLSDLTTPPDIGVLLNLYEEHMDWHGDVERYHAAKIRMAELMSEDDVLVYNERFPQMVELAKRVKAEVIGFALHDEPVLAALHLLGEHNKENACAVLAVARHLDVDERDILKAFDAFAPIPHRLEVLGEVGGITFVNDSISTTPQSALAAIDVFGDRLGAVILGGHDRGYDFSELARRLRAMSGVRIYVMPGGDRLFDALVAQGLEPKRVQTFDDVIPDVQAHLGPGTVCLLSPASPSYGQFKNFEQRGAMFKKAVFG